MITELLSRIYAARSHCSALFWHMKQFWCCQAMPFDPVARGLHNYIATVHDTE